jgi:hypothetical protein
VYRGCASIRRASNQNLCCSVERGNLQKSKEELSILFCVLLKLLHQNVALLKHSNELIIFDMFLFYFQRYENVNCVLKVYNKDSFLNTAEAFVTRYKVKPNKSLEH